MSDSGSPASGSSLSSARDLHVVAGVIRHNGRILAARRFAGGPSGLKWEFPGGKVEAGEASREALAREIREELGLIMAIHQEIGTFPTVLGAVRINLQCFHCRAETGQVTLAAHSEVRWCMQHELCALDWALPDVPVVSALLAHHETEAGE